MTVLVIVLIGILYTTFRFSPGKWIDQYGKDAETYASIVLSGTTSPIPPSLTNYYIESGNNYVSFCIPSEPLGSHGMAYSTDGKKPKRGLGGEPHVVIWTHVKENWYTWASD